MSHYVILLLLFSLVKAIIIIIIIIECSGDILVFFVVSCYNGKVEFPLLGGLLTAMAREGCIYNY